MNHLAAVAPELAEHEFDKDGKIDLAKELCELASEILVAIAQDRNYDAEALKVAEIAFLLSKHIEQETSPADEPQKEEPKKLPWAVISHNHAEVAQPFFPAKKLDEDEEIDLPIIQEFEDYSEAVAFAQQLDENTALVNIDWDAKMYSFRRIFEVEEDIPEGTATTGV